MKKHFISNLIALLFLTMLLPLTNFAQVKVAWKKELKQNLQWQQVSPLGNLITSSYQGLSRIDSKTGETLWNKREFQNISKEQYQEVPGSPFFSITHKKAFYLIDEFTGKEVFNSTKAGIKEVKDFFLLFDSNTILVAGENKKDTSVIALVKMSDGSLIWSKEEEYGRIIELNELSKDEMLLVTVFDNYRIKTATGKIVWKKANSKEAEAANKMTGLFAQLKKSIAKKLNPDDINIQFHRKPNDNIFCLATEKVSDMNPNIVYNNYSLYNINTGKRIWNKHLEVKGNLGHLVFDKNGLIVLPGGERSTKINLYDYETKKGKWGKKGRGLKVKGGIYDYITFENGILLVSRKSSKSYLTYLDHKKGVLTFEKPIKVKGDVVGIVPFKNSVLYITTQRINILDYTAGELKWKEGISTSPELTAQHDNKIYAFDYNTRTVKVIDKATEQVTELSKTGINFDGKEYPRFLEITKDGVLLTSDQNLAKIGFDGTVKYNKYYPAPRESGWKRALLYATAVRASLVSAQSYYISGTLAKAGRKTKDKNTSRTVNKFSNMYEDIGEGLSNYSNDAFKAANARFKATKAGKDFMFIMSQEKNKEIVLLKVSKVTGEVEGKILLGKNRKPNYTLDGVTGQVYYLNNKTLTSYQTK